MRKRARGLEEQQNSKVLNLVFWQVLVIIFIRMCIEAIFFLSKYIVQCNVNRKNLSKVLYLVKGPENAGPLAFLLVRCC